MSKDDKKSITPAYEYKVDGYRYQLMRDIAIANNSAVNNLVGALTSLTISESNMFSLISTLEEEVCVLETTVADLTNENLRLKFKADKEIELLRQKIHILESCENSKEFWVDTGFSPCYEYAVFKDGDIFSCLHIYDELDAIAYMESLKKDHPNSNLYLCKRLKVSWEPIEEENK